MSKALGLISLLLMLGCAVCTVAWAGLQIEHRSHSSEPATEFIYLPQAKFLKPLSLGYRNVLADVLWFRTISYFGEHYRSDRTYRWLGHMCNLVTDLDPAAEYVYRFCGIILPWEANQVEEGIQVLEKGVRYLPDSWLIHFWLGFNYYFFKGDYEDAIRHMRRSAELPGSHASATRLAALLYQHQYGPQLAVQFLGELERSIGNDQMREIVQHHIREARLAADLQRLTAAVAKYRARFGVIPKSPHALVEQHLLLRIPRDPFGGVYEIDPTDGHVRSSTGHRPSELHQSARRGAALRGESLRE